MPSPVELEASISKQGAIVKQAKALARGTGSEADAVGARDAVSELLRLKDALVASNAANESVALPTTSSGEVDYAQDFFGRRAYLAVSGQLNGTVNVCEFAGIQQAPPTVGSRVVVASRQDASSLTWLASVCFAAVDAGSAPCANALSVCRTTNGRNLVQARCMLVL